MRKLYIIPGWRETCRRKPYQLLASRAKRKGYQVELIKINWGKNLSEQIFPVPSNAIVFGFSLGAIFAWLVAQKSPCRQIILASMTPLRYFRNKKDIRLLAQVTGKDFVADIKKNIRSKHLAKKQIIFYG